MTRRFEWHLRRKLAEHGLFKTTELGPLLAARGVNLSREQVYRLVTSPPQRLNIEVLDALCQILSCTPSDLITFEEVSVEQPKAANGDARSEVDVSGMSPVPARIRRPRSE